MCECVPETVSFSCISFAINLDSNALTTMFQIDGHNWNRFIARNLHECIYTPLDYTAFSIGWTSLVFWFCCQIPQFYKVRLDFKVSLLPNVFASKHSARVQNYKNKSAAALSIVFLAEWFAGDLLNLVSSFLTGQLTTQIATATLFVCMDLCLCSQWIYYSKIYVKRDEEEEEEGQDEENLYQVIDNDDDRKHKEDFDKQHVSSFAMFTPLLMFGGGVFLLNRYNLETTGMHGAMRHLMSTKECDATAIGNDTTKTIGVVLAYCSATVYLTSRLPQILKNYTRKSVAGLSPYMFMCAVMGNLTYALGVLIKKPSESELVDALPFLIGSLGTICFDLVILMQHFYYEYYYNKKSDRPGYLMRFDTTAREHLPHGIHNIVDPMASPFFPQRKRLLICDTSPSNINQAHRRNSN